MCRLARDWAPLGSPASSSASSYQSTCACSSGPPWTGLQVGLHGASEVFSVMQAIDDEDVSFANCGTWSLCSPTGTIPPTIATVPSQQLS